MEISVSHLVPWSCISGGARSGYVLGLHAVEAEQMTPGVAAGVCELADRLISQVETGAGVVRGVGA